MTLRGLYEYMCSLTRLWREAPLAPPLGELLSEREAEGVRFVHTQLCPICSRPVGVDY